MSKRSYSKILGRLSLSLACTLGVAASASAGFFATLASDTDGSYAESIDELHIFDALGANSFRFKTLDVKKDGVLLFEGLGAGDTATIVAEEVVRINGVLELGRDVKLVINAPGIELGPDAYIYAPGGTVTLAAGRNGGSLVVADGAQVDVFGTGARLLQGPIMLGSGGIVSLSAGKGLQVAGAVPEADVLAMLLAGLGMIGLLSRRRRGD